MKVCLLILVNRKILEKREQQGKIHQIRTKTKFPPLECKGSMGHPFSLFQNQFNSTELEKFRVVKVWEKKNEGHRLAAGISNPKTIK
jgi:hypothetical protein